MKDPDFHIIQCSLGVEEGGQNRDKSAGKDLFFSFFFSAYQNHHKWCKLPEQTSGHIINGFCFRQWQLLRNKLVIEIMALIISSWSEKQLWSFYLWRASFQWEKGNNIAEDCLWWGWRQKSITALASLQVLESLTGVSTGLVLYKIHWLWFLHVTAWLSRREGL